MARIPQETIDKINHHLSKGTAPKDIAGLLGIPIHQVYHIKKMNKENQSEEPGEQSEPAEETSELEYGNDPEIITGWALFWREKYLKEHAAKIELEALSDT